jgi:predicted nuclease with TOPRIM domain
MISGAMMKQVNRRGLSTMRTHINRRLSASRQPHEIYMKLTSLEIERSRRMTERDAMNNRIRLLEERLTEIEVEQAELNQMLGERQLPLPHAADSNPRTYDRNTGSLKY